MTDLLDLIAQAEANTVGPSGKGGLTSWLASLDNANRSGGQRYELLDAFYRWGDLGLTDEEALTATHSLSVNAVRPRRGELASIDLVEHAGVLRATRSGNAAVVWRITEAGRRVVERRREIVG